MILNYSHLILFCNEIWTKYGTTENNGMLDQVLSLLPIMIQPRFETKPDSRKECKISIIRLANMDSPQY